MHTWVLTRGNRDQAVSYFTQVLESDSACRRFDHLHLLGRGHRPQPPWPLDDRPDLNLDLD